MNEFYRRLLSIWLVATAAFGALMYCIYVFDLSLSPVAGIAWCAMLGWFALTLLFVTVVAFGWSNPRNDLSGRPGL